MTLTVKDDPNLKGVGHDNVLHNLQFVPSVSCFCRVFGRFSGRSGVGFNVDDLCILALGLNEKPATKGFMKHPLQRKGGKCSGSCKGHRPGVLGGQSEAGVGEKGEGIRKNVHIPACCTRVGSTIQRTGKAAQQHVRSKSYPVVSTTPAAKARSRKNTELSLAL